LVRFDVFLSPDGTLLLDVQADLITRMATRVVAPLLPAATAPMAIGRLNPIFEIDGKHYVLFPQLISAIAQSSLSHPIGNLRNRSDEISGALDMLLYGF
jgi:toxin CcdB